MTENPEIPYYMKDFLHVLETVEMQYGADFTESEQQFVAKLRALTLSARCLYVRLVNRSKQYFSVTKINYPECDPLVNALEELLANELIVLVLPQAPDICEIMADCYTVAELKQLKSRTQPKLKTKADYIVRLQEADDRAWWIEQLLACNPIVSPVCEPWQFFAYLYFGQITPNLSAFVVKELGHLTPETIESAKYERAFVSRLHAEIKCRHDRCYEQFRDLRTRMTALELYQWWKDQRLPAPIDSTTSQTHDHMIERMGGVLAKSECYDLAITTYRQCISDTCALPLAKLLRKRGFKEEALTVCKERLLDSPDPEIAQQGSILMQRLAGKRARSQAHEALADKPIEIIASASCVEYAALKHLQHEGWSGIHSENWLWCAFFGAALWPVIYDPTHGGFTNSLQLAPSDLWRPEFYAKRAEAIDTRISSFTSKAILLREIGDMLDAKKDVTNPFFRWQPDLGTHMARLCTRLPLAGLKAVLRRMATDPGQFLRGFPDLFVWRDEGEYSFIEVKSENDKLSAHQLAWINSFNAFGITTRILRVKHVRTVRIRQGAREVGALQSEA